MQPFPTPSQYKPGGRAALWLAISGCALVALIDLASAGAFDESAQARLYAVPPRTTGQTGPNTSITDTFALLNIKPYGIPGVVNELNISIWGTNSWRRGGDAYSPQYVSGNTPNPEYPTMPYGYLYRIDVPASFPDDHLLVQIFDPDTYNNPTPPPPPYVPAPSNTTVGASPTSTPRPSPTYYANDGRFTYCGPVSDRTETCLKQGAFPLTTTPVPTVFNGARRPGLWRIDMFWRDHSNSPGPSPNFGEWQDAWANTTDFTLWHFDPQNTNPLDNPNDLSDQPGHAPIALTYTVGLDPATDLAWYQPPGFDIALVDPTCTGPNHDCFAARA